LGRHKTIRALKIPGRHATVRKYLKELNEYKNSLHEGNNHEAAAVFGEQQPEEEDDELTSEATTSSMEDEDKDQLF
jgi:hypothetical protein